MPQMRLDKLLAQQTGISRKEAAALARSGAVQLNGQPLTDPAAHVSPEQVTLHGEKLDYQQFVYWILNKPAGLLTAARDARQPVVLDLLPPEQRRRGVQPVGRLDKDTTGLLLLTNDGALAHRLLSPRHHVWKIYQARLSCPPRAGAQQRFAAGVQLPDFTCLPARLRLLENGSTPLYEVALREGKFHQVKRMFAAQDSEVTALCRTEFGPLSLPPDLPQGALRPLTAAEQAALLGQGD
ncbi:MAG: rRNA pseudouridine synthase [Oscillospiraceae bacterium]|nr:rRNA pseudouridine synthase [Oscillospiraceae bacterium]MDD3261336.1 pseudouridine synthase [Oscillospiraceae bacterium]